jgi:hypothetical protein
MIARRQRKMSQQQEEKVASDLGGRTVLNSGAEKFSGGGDVRVRSELRVECKQTEKTFYVLQHSDLLKIWKQAVRAGESPVFQVRFNVPRMAMHEFAIVPGHLSSETPLFVTDRKRMKLTLTDLTKALLSRTCAPIVINKDEWTILYWSTYLKNLESARADDQHNL